MEVAIIDVNIKDQKEYALKEDILNAFMQASIDDVIGLKKSLEVVSVNERDEHGMTMLHHAAIGLGEESVELLLSKDGIDATIEDNFGRSASFATLEVNGDSEEVLRMTDMLAPYCYPTIHNL